MCKLTEDTTVSHEPVFITGKRGKAVLLAKNDWNAINKTIHLLKVLEMCVSILKSMLEKIGYCTAELGW